MAWSRAIWSPSRPFLVHNEELLDEVERLQAKLRRRDIVIGQWQRFAFYDQRLPAEVYDGVQLARWLRESPENARQITMTKADLLPRRDRSRRKTRFPISWPRARGNCRWTTSSSRASSTTA